jgi:S1-C subfamily serine protease
MREYKFKVGDKVYAIGQDFDAEFVGKVTKRGFVDGNFNAYAVSSPKYKEELFLEHGLISAETAYAMIEN